MDRPPRKTKMVNYCDSQDFGDDDDDFSSTKAPPRKKAREELKQQKMKSSSKYSSQEDSDSQSKISSQDRKPLVEKVLKRDLEAALTLSLLHSSDGKEDQSPNVTDVEECPTQEDENVPPSLQHISNCSVNIAVLGLEQITAEQGSHCAPSRQRKAACSAQEPHRAKSKEDDEDYLPKMTPDTDSDDDFSDAPESEDEEFTVKKINKTSKKDKKIVIIIKKTQAPPKTLVSKKEKQPSKTAKSHTAAISQPGRSPPPTKISQPDRSPPPTKISQPDRSPPPTKTPSTSKRPAISGNTPASHPLSPAGGSRVPKWTPPGQVGKSPGSSQTVPGRSPGQGLRLGLSRRVRVKPLHPSVTSH